MKAINYLAHCCAFICLLSSCNDETINMESHAPNNQSIQLVKIENGKVLSYETSRSSNTSDGYALKFATEDIYNSVIFQLSNMTTKEKLAYITKLGLTSLQKTSIIADTELEKIGAEAIDENDFREKYEIYKNKYEGILIPNLYDDNDLSLYVPDGDNILTYLVSNTKTIVVGEEVRSISLTNDMSESDKAVFTPKAKTLYSRAVTWYDNGFNEKYAGGNKKLTFDVSIKDPAERTMNVHLGAQKDMWYGWKRDTAREFYFESYLDNFIYLATTGTHIVEVPRSQRYCYGDCGGKLDIILGKGGAFTSIPISGKMYVWTDMIAESDANGNPLYENINVWGGTQMVTVSARKCLESKAFHVNVNL